MAEARPNTADASTLWRQRLRAAVLPTVADGAAWKALLDCKDDLEALQQQIAADLPIALSVLCEANRSPRIAANLSGLQHALRMFGCVALLKQLQRYPGDRLDPTQPTHRQVLQALADSRLACLIHARWMLHDVAGDADYRFWVTALLGVMRWKLPLIDPALCAELDRRVAAGERRAAAERALLGLSTAQLTTQHLQDLGFAMAEDLAKRMQLPPGLMRAAARLARDNERPLSAAPELARRLREPMLSCRLAYALALEAQNDWHSQRTDLLLRIAATCFGRSVSSLRYDLERAALQASEESAYGRELLAPAARMIRLPHPRPDHRRADDSTPSTEASQLLAGHSALSAPHPANRPVPRPADFIARCIKQEFSSTGEFLAAAAQHLQQQGIGRCALLLRMRNPERIGVYFAHGFSDAKAARAIQFPPEQGGLLKGLLSNPRAALLIAPAQLESLNGKLPQALESWQPERGLMLASVAVNNTAVGLWWAEPAAPHSADPQQLAALRQMMHGFGAEFTRLLRAHSATQQAKARSAASST
ncbi:hypothetical protein [Pseudomarimonas arenosa]|uniref:HDOD domain-containing protein n=1 Tax=Pseudomarimonas arenosa TaxID=2774145 RepID=A0AAW3ZIK5_9GAMM|nr:hypothetical protein [Pseudomarimonas arenosa]MBD8525826.1 hypothetical protein [Pseudomarimonas arenosa]